ncbi:MAG TPA: hypothetical protein PLB32_25390 [Acidobacteriota bacterium]|nr:hypothetical protein [Acidobacteriota bacterium]HNG96162.1 hypothetical protein [Acidobacteriota bacterium]
MIRYLMSILLGVFIAGLVCSLELSASTSVQPSLVQTKQMTSREVEQLVGNRARAVVAALRDRDMDVLSSFVHPKKRVRFSPSAYINPQSDIVFTQTQVKNLFTAQKRYVWGESDGSGAPIRLTPKQYFSQFLYQRDYLKSPKVAFNQVIGEGNTVNNISEIYPQGIFVEYYVPGRDKTIDYRDWSSLRIVFEESNHEWYVVGLVHDGWSI